MYYLYNPLQYALKKMVVRVTEDGIPQSIIREISALRALHSLDHPNIVKFVSLQFPFLFLKWAEME